MLTLRPEGTAPVCRAYVEHGMHKLPQPVKLWYHCPMFRYEKPQAGRYREHYQIGAEAIGSADPAVDAEVILLLAAIFDELGVEGVTLNMNSMGDPQCRPAYVEKLRAYLRGREGDLCGDCLERIDINPLRTFDCKVEACRAVLDEAPRISDHLCPDCREHFDAVLALVRAAGLDPTLDFRLVRGLDYYTRTTFEFNSDRLGAQSGVGGGGRYDGLVEQIGGQPTPGVGWGSGLERIALAMREPLAAPRIDRRLRRRLQRRRTRGRRSAARRRCAAPACRPIWTSPGAAPRASSSRPGAVAPASPCCSGSKSSATAWCDSRTLPAAGKRTSPPPTSRRSSSPDWPA